MEAGHISMGYDAVDNEYLAKGAANVRSAERGERKAYQGRTSEVRRRHQLPARYFLASARFIERKNLPRLIAAYARYRSLTRSKGHGAGEQVRELVMLGDGPLRPALRSQLNALGLHACVHLRGFQHYEELPVFYGLADAFVHASTTEQWGLVVNEAMASGLPVMVSNRCGCVYDLVREGCNGFAFDPYDVEQLVRLMLRVGEMEDEERTPDGGRKPPDHCGLGPGPICPRFEGGDRVCDASGTDSRGLAGPTAAKRADPAMKVALLMDSVSRNAGGLYDAVRRLGQSLQMLGEEVRVLGVEDERTSADLAGLDAGVC